MIKHIITTIIWLSATALIFSVSLTASIAQTNPDVEILVTEGDTSFCIGESVTLAVSSDETPDSVRWNPEDLFANPTALETTITPEQTTEVELEFFAGDTVFTISQTIVVDTLSPLEFTTRDTTICQGESLQLTIGIGDLGATYAWTPNEYLSDSSAYDAIATPQSTITYVLFAESENGLCTEVDSVEVEVLPNELEIQLDDIHYVCLDTPTTEVVLQTNFNPPGSTFEWQPNDGSLNDRTIASPTATIDFSTRYTVHMVTPDGCESRDTVVVRLDSLPQFEYVVVPEPREECNKYCPGDFITIFSNPANPENFPDINYEWSPEDGSIQDDITNQNISIEASVPQYYVRTNMNNACESVDSIFIDVVEPEVPITPSDTVICANEPVQIEIDPTDLTDIEWSPAEGLSCTDCPNPIAITGETTTYTIEATKEECCPVSASVTINVIYPPIPIEDLIACPGEPIQILVDSEGFSDPSWSGPVDMLSCTDCFEPFATVNTTTTFQLTAFDEEGCESRGNVEVDVFSPPDQLEIEASPGNEIPIGTIGEFELLSFPTVPVDDIVWLYNGEVVAEGVRAAQIEIVEEDANNVITAMVLDENGCERVVNINISGIEPVFEVPNVFTPGGQQEVNQYFRPVVTNAELFDGSFITDFKIWNRWGQLVYNNNDNETGWDGRQNGSRAPSDVYVYVIEISLPNGDTRTLKGDVTLLR
ncbi:MAG: gliding motility-associated C-terminal domain-containing protein [Saprospirales bacterium]|nr:MAG: gliding motility-associated C-terminal domain-containing protein [Saprospirales bacterium]